MITKATNQLTLLKRRVQRFYALLNQGDFASCHRMIDPRVREKPASVTLLQYENAARDFIQDVGTIAVQRIDVALHLNEPSELYEGRDFAVGQTKWKDQEGNERSFAERWVREGRSWYTRSTGLIAPTSAVARRS